MAASEKVSQNSDSELEQPLLDEIAEKEQCSDHNEPKHEETKRHYYERQLGIWTLYYPITGLWIDSMPTLVAPIRKVYSLVKSIPIVWKFLLETLSLGPLYFVLYFISSGLSSIMPSVQLQNNSRILDLVGYLHILLISRHLIWVYYDRPSGRLLTPTTAL
jgi:hypothetical protein